MLNKYYFLGLFCCLFCACQSNMKEQMDATPFTSNEKGSVVFTPTIKVDTSYNELPKPEPVDSHNYYYQPNKNSKALKRFLTAPIDLPKFKKKNRANSTVSKGTDYYLKPKEKGFYYHYFLFRGCSERRLMIDVYMYGDSPGSYSKANETLVDLRSCCELEDLEALNLVGKEWGIVKEKYGNNYLKMDNKRIYAYKGNLLLINLRREKISSYRYIRTNLRQIKSVGDIPKALFQEAI